jgi:hypothetical protein
MHNSLAVKEVKITRRVSSGSTKGDRALSFGNISNDTFSRRSDQPGVAAERRLIKPTIAVRKAVIQNLM